MDPHFNTSSQSEIVLNTQFNQDGSCLAISTNLGFKIYSLLHATRILKLYQKSDLGIVSLVEMQFRTNILAYVTRNAKNSEKSKENQQYPKKLFFENFEGGDSSSENRRKRQRKLTIYDTKQHLAVLEILFHSKILKLEMNYTHIYLASKDHIFIFALTDMQLVKRLKVPNHLLRISMNPSPGHILAYSDVLNQGKIFFADLPESENLNSEILTDPYFPVSKIKFNQKGDLLAVTSAHNNLIQVWQNSIKYCTLELTFAKYTLVDLAFCPLNRFLVALFKEGSDDFLQLFYLDQNAVIQDANPQSPNNKKQQKQSCWSKLFGSNKNIKPIISIKLEKSKTNSALQPKCSLRMETAQYGKIFVTNSDGHFSCVQIRKSIKREPANFCYKNHTYSIENQPKTVVQAVFEKSVETLDGNIDTPCFISETGVKDTKSNTKCEYFSQNGLEAEYLPGHQNIYLL